MPQLPDPIETIRENYMVSSDSEIGRMLGVNKDRVRYLRNKHGLVRANRFGADLNANGFQPENWSHGWMKTDNSSIFIQNTEGMITTEEIKEQMLAEIKQHAPKYSTIKRKPIKDGHLLIVDPADTHIGKLALSDETNGEYNIEIAKTRCLEGVDGIIQKANGFPIDRITLPIGNDSLHTDTPFQKTTAGTPQDTDGMWWKAYQEARKLYVQMIENLVTVADLDVIFCPSNHDYMSGYLLAQHLETWFRHTKNINFYTKIVHRKYLRYGNSMLGFDHGDGCKEQDAPLIMAQEEPLMWGETKFRYFYRHHVHHHKRRSWLGGKDYPGATVTYLRSVSSPDGWHHRNGYIAMPAVEGFVHSPTAGQVAHLTHSFT